MNDAFRLLRVLNDLSIKELATSLELSEDYISKLESGELDNPSMAVIRLYARQFSATPSAILYLSENLSKDIPGLLRKRVLALMKFIEEGKG
jgi:transcriptional regulator with XRE-family HTH domain